MLDVVAAEREACGHHPPARREQRAENVLSSAAAIRSPADALASIIRFALAGAIAGSLPFTPDPGAIPANAGIILRMTACM